jgi:hypothetical protein
MNNDRAWRVGLTLLAFICAAQPVLAAPGSPPQLVIVSARADSLATTLTIDGHSFGDGQPVVTFNGMPLVIVSATSSEIVADLPPGLAPATYLLTVSRGPATTQFDSFNVTLGAVGAPGPAGATGPQGPAGATGPQGPAGTFSGHFQSPNGAYSLDVTDTGIRLAGPAASIQLVGGTVTIMATNVTVRSDITTEIRSGVNTTLLSSASTEIQSGANTTIISGGSTNIEGNPVFLNGGGQPAARAGDTVQVNTGSGTGSIVTGSTTVFIGN